MHNVLIFGDSYSTFQGYTPSGYVNYYPNLDVHRVEETWWARFIEKTNGNLIGNNSWSGTKFGYTENNGVCVKDSSFVSRYEKLKREGFFAENRVDTVFVFGGTNDSWADVPLGEMKISDWEEKDLFHVFPAICYFAYMLKNDLPKAEIIFIVNTGLKEEIRTCIETVAEYYGARSVRLENIDKVNCHPTKKGMLEISEQLLKAFI
ncbi:MAG: hypothetical protein IJB97_04670 [Clostridia bacterium]|nr:hypothetical protein [Clostridia bacterium]